MLFGHLIDFDNINNIMEKCKNVEMGKESNRMVKRRFGESQ